MLSIYQVALDITPEIEKLISQIKCGRERGARAWARAWARARAWA